MGDVIARGIGKGASNSLANYLPTAWPSAGNFNLSSNSWSATCKARKNSIGQIEFIVSGTSTAGTCTAGTVIGAIPAGLRPQTPIIVSFPNLTASSYSVVMLRLEVNGNVTYLSGAASGNTWGGVVMFSGNNF